MRGNNEKIKSWPPKWLKINAIDMTRRNKEKNASVDKRVEAPEGFWEHLFMIDIVIYRAFRNV